MIILNILIFILNFLFPKTMETIKSGEYIKGEHDENLRERASREKTRRFTLEINYPVGEIFISIGNEWNAMHLIEIIGYDGELPIGRDILSNNEYILFSTLIKYSESMISALKKLTPYERYGICHQKVSILDREDKIEEQDCLFENELSAIEFIALFNKEKEKNND